MAWHGMAMNVQHQEILTHWLLQSFSDIVDCLLPTVQALVELYRATNGDQWLNNANWLQGDPCLDHWFGVTCFTSSGVTAMYVAIRMRAH
jgi:hypothetical protein